MRCYLSVKEDSQVMYTLGLFGLGDPEGDASWSFLEEEGRVVACHKVITFQPQMLAERFEYMQTQDTVVVLDWGK